jgi:hypothetical protein
MFLMIVIKPWETSIPMQKLSHALLMFGLDVSHGSMTVMISILCPVFMFALVATYD